MKELVSKFWAEWEPHLSLWAGVGVVVFGPKQDPIISIIILTATGGPAVRDAIVSVLKAWKGTP